MALASEAHCFSHVIGEHQWAHLHRAHFFFYSVLLLFPVETRDGARLNAEKIVPVRCAVRPDEHFEQRRLLRNFQHRGGAIIVYWLYIGSVPSQKKIISC